ncbi:MAG: endonuclease domain-containing protein [Mycobacteriales bacterium]
MSEGVRALLARAGKQQGLFTRADAYARGVSPAGLRWRCRPAGCWQHVVGDVYAGFTGQLSERQRLVAALLYAGASAMVTGPTACVAWGLANSPANSQVHVLLARGGRRRNSGFVVIHRTTHLPRPCNVNGLPTAPLERAVVDSVVLLDELRAVRALIAESVQRGLVTPQQIAAEASRSRRPTPLLNQVLSEVSAGARSVAEAALLKLLRQSGLPEPVVNVPIEVNGRILVPDFRWGRLVLELDSAAWHLSPELWRRTQERHNLLVAAGFRVLHVAPADLTERPGWVLARIRECHELDQASQ